MRMRIPRSSWRYFVVALLVNLIILFVLSLWQNKTTSVHTPSVTDAPQATRIKPRTKPFLTIIYQDFDEFENHIEELAAGIPKNISDITVLVIADSLPYPPIRLPKLTNVHLIVLKAELNQNLNATRPDSFIKTDYVLFLPDGVTITSSIVSSLRNFVRSEEYREEQKLYGISVAGSKLRCHGVVYSKKEWTLDIGSPLKSKSNCGLISGEHGIFVKSDYLHFLPNPFHKPTFTSMYVQSPASMKAVILEDVYLPIYKPLYKDPHNWWKHKQLLKERLRTLYSLFGIKRVIHGTGQTEWYGCSKDSQRCFGTVYNDMPDYLHQGRWTPPCCLKALRETGKHVFSILEGCKIRYWLEGGSLLGAARNKDIIPWDYDIDVGIYSEDIVKCTQLAKVVEEGTFVDEDGFVWEKAIEGDFYRIHYSETNRLHVDIFPFFSRKGIMTKNSWFKTHKQDTEFPEHYLTPLTKVQFAGLNVSAPNNVKKFLEYKFGKGVIQNPRYPNAAPPV